MKGWSSLKMKMKFIENDDMFDCGYYFIIISWQKTTTYSILFGDGDFFHVKFEKNNRNLRLFVRGICENPS